MIELLSINDVLLIVLSEDYNKLIMIYISKKKISDLWSRTPDVDDVSLNYVNNVVFIVGYPWIHPYLLLLSLLLFYHYIQVKLCCSTDLEHRLKTHDNLLFYHQNDK